MQLYPLLLFIHVSGAICLFIGMGIWLFSSIAIARAARVEHIRTLADLMLMVRMAVPAGALAVIAAGVAMTWIAWGFQTGWIRVALGSLAIIGPIGTWVIDPKVRAIATLAHTLQDGPLTTPLAALAHDSALCTTLSTSTAMLFGIIFLMTAKPTLMIAIGAMMVAAFLGLAAAVAFAGARPARASERVNQHEEDTA